MQVLDTTAATHLNLLLDEIARALQLTPTQHAIAEQRYRAVSDWLSREGSPLAVFCPRVFAQGSVAIGTTVRPRGREEHDVDLVLLLHMDSMDAMGLYRLVRDRLAANATYKAILEGMNRCLRLKYAGEFHLDILPARPDPDRHGTWLLVPDRELRSWSPSDPEGFAGWFLQNASQPYQKMSLETEPLPELEDADAKSPLQRAVQLLKRRRDVYFDGDDDAPRSVVLTTLAARAHRGERTALAALEATLDNLAAEIEGTSGIIEVQNPTRPQENFAEKWNNRSYYKFVCFVREFRGEMDELGRVQGTDKIVAQLRKMFGENPVNAAFKAWGVHFQQEREAGRLRAGIAGLTTVAAPRTRPVKQHQFYGDNET